MFFGNSKKFRDSPDFFRKKITSYTKLQFQENNIVKKIFLKPVLCNLVNEL